MSNDKTTPADKSTDPKNQDDQNTGITKNPNPRANANVEDPAKPEPADDTTGVGSEITDGEAG